MKKSFYFALALTAGLFASCSSDEIAQAPTQVIDENAPAEIKLGVKSDITVTRGTGTVGADPTTGAVGYGWAGQTFNVYMLDKGKLSTAVQQYGVAYDADDNPYVYNNAEFKAPEQGAADATAALETGVAAYYPTEGKYDFWAYRLDDADDGDPKLVAAADLTTAVAADAADYIVAPFKIDGSQDVMVAEVEKSGNVNATGYTDDDLYSAKTGRRDIRPQFNFKHLLTRLTFKVLADNVAVSDQAADLPGALAHGQDYFKGFKVTKISVRSADTGNLIVAYKKDANDPTNDPTLDQRLIWTATAADWANTAAKYDDDITNDANAADALPELFLQSRTEGITAPAQGSFVTINNFETRDVTNGFEITLPTNPASQMTVNGNTILWSDNTSKNQITGRPSSTGKKASAWRTDGQTGTLYYWYESQAPTTDNQLNASTNLDELQPVVPGWDANAGTTYTWTAYTGAYYKWTVKANYQVAGGEVALQAAPVDGITGVGTVGVAGTVYSYDDGNGAVYYDVTTTLADANFNDDAADPTTATVGAVGDVKRNGANYFSCTAVNNNGEGVATSVGEALLVAPAPAAGYVVTVYYSHYKPVNATTCALDETGKISKVIVLRDNTGTRDAVAYKRAKQYNITIKLFKDGTAESNVGLEDFGDDNDASLDPEYSFE